MKHPRLVDLENKIIAKLKAEGLTILSPWKEIEDCLSKTVAPDFCIKCAKDLAKIKNETRQLKFKGF